MTRLLPPARPSRRAVAVRGAPDLDQVITHEWLIHLPGMRGSKGQYSGPCPVHGGRRMLSLTAGRTRIIYHCHHKPGSCSQETLREALIAAGITNLPARQHRKPPADQFRDQILHLLGQPLNPAEFRFRVAMAAWECNPQTAADELGLSRRTYYRLLYPRARNGTEPQVTGSTASARNGTVERSTAVPKVARHRRSAT